MACCPSLQISIMNLSTSVRLWFYNHFKHVSISGGVNCSLGKIKLAVCGKNNSIRLGNHVRLDNVEMKVFGNNNQIMIEDGNTISGVRFAIEDDGNLIKIHEHVYIGSGSLLAALEGTKIEIGRDCMIAGPCEIRTSDSHSLTDMEGNRINPAKDIEIGHHVWIGAGCMILKGCHIPNDSIIAARSVVTSTKGFDSYSLWGGQPAKHIKSNVNWDKQRF